jgi:radical SAM superfamily enzyme YgiQ (UPF0313 family)
MQRVLIIAANQERMPDPIPPLGAAYIAAAVRKSGHVSRIYYACFAKDRYAEELAAAIDEFAPDIIGLSIRNVDNVAFPNVTCYLDRYQKIVGVCRDKRPDATLFLGGSAFSLFPEEFAKKLDIDYGIVGEGENMFVKMVDEIDQHGRVVGEYANEDGVVFPGMVADLDAAVDPARDLLDVSRYFTEGGSINIQTKRGCVYKCIYCTYPVLEGNTVRQREPKLVVDEIERAVNEHGVDFFFFVDNVFNYPAAHCEAICREILARGLKVRWTAYVTPANCTREMFALMRESGCQSMDLGTDCFSDPQLKRMGKSFTVEQIFDVSKWCREFDIKYSHSLILGGPGESWDTLKETVENTIRSSANAVIAILGVRLYRDTAMAQYAISRGLVTRDEIGITPMFFISDEIREGVIEYLDEVATRYKNWIIPGLKKGMNQRFFQRVRGRGVKGPLWELFEPMEYEGLPADRVASAVFDPLGQVVDKKGIFRGADDQDWEAEVTELRG